jgi:hypothetical protein
LSRTALLQEWNSEAGSSKPWMMMLALPIKEFVEDTERHCSLYHHPRN